MTIASPVDQDVRELRLERWIPGGLCLAHAEGRTWIVSYGIPGERVSARVTRKARGVVFADVIDVHEASPYRVSPPCPYFGPGLCGGCDVQHVDVPEQRRMKREIVLDSLMRIAGVDASALECVEITREVPGEADGLRWRSRLSGVRTVDGIGVHRARSNDVVSVRDCLIAASGLVEAVEAQVAPGQAFRAALGDDGAIAVDVEADSSRATVAQFVTIPPTIRRWRLPIHAFWQVHLGVGQFLGSLVLDLLGDVHEERWWDLYAGAGLFTAFLSAGGACRIDLVESDQLAIRAARRTFHDEPSIAIHHREVVEWLDDEGAVPDGVVVDPPRRGCDAVVITAIGRVRPQRVVYVSCDPGSFSRDTARLAAEGYRPERVIPVDAFPMTHHVETVALFVPDDQIS